MSELHIRAATEADIPDILRLVRALAAYEHEPVETVRMSEADLRRYGFGQRPYFEVLLADHDGQAVGFALFFHNFSTWAGRPGIYVEDLFVDHVSADRVIQELKATRSLDAEHRETAIRLARLRGESAEGEPNN